MKIKIEFCEFWFKTKDGATFYKAHFRIDNERTAFVPIKRLVEAGTEVVLKVSRDKTGRATLSVAS